MLDLVPTSLTKECLPNLIIKTVKSSLFWNHPMSVQAGPSNPTAKFALISVYWCGVVKGQDTGSGVNKVETTAGVWQQ